VSERSTVKNEGLLQGKWWLKWIEIESTQKRPNCLTPVTNQGDPGLRNGPNIPRVYFGIAWPSSQRIQGTPDSWCFVYSVLSPISDFSDILDALQTASSTATLREKLLKAESLRRKHQDGPEVVNAEGFPVSSIVLTTCNRVQLHATTNEK
jgi:hypothetical protein